MSRYQDYLEVPKDGIVRDKMTDNKNKRGGSASRNAKNYDSHDTSKRCQFCGQVSENFANEKKYDMHLFKECPLLVCCNFCNAVQQISSYNDHLLSSMCVGRHKQCPRCKQAVLREEYDDHIKKMACAPARRPEEASRCPLCATDIPPGPEGWTIHIMRDGCPNNERTPFTY